MAAAPPAVTQTALQTRLGGDSGCLHPYLQAPCEIVSQSSEAIKVVRMKVQHLCSKHLKRYKSTSNQLCCCRLRAELANLQAELASARSTRQPGSPGGGSSSGGSEDAALLRQQLDEAR